MTEQANGQQRGRDGYVYLVRAASGEHKIGWSKDPRARLSSLASGSPFPLELVHQIPSDDGAWAESLLHAKYAEYRVHGEWFKLPQEATDRLIRMRRPINRPDWSKPKQLEQWKNVRKTIQTAVWFLDKQTSDWKCANVYGLIVCLMAPDGSGLELSWEDETRGIVGPVYGNWKIQLFGRKSAVANNKATWANQQDPRVGLDPAKFPCCPRCNCAICGKRSLEESMAKQASEAT